MASTWRQTDRKEWSIHQHAIDALNIHPTSLDEHVPVHSKTDKIPYLSQWPLHVWVLFYACIPLAIHQALLSLTSYESLNKATIFILYFFGFNAIVVRQVHLLRRLGHTYGFLDGDTHERDGVPDASVKKVATSLLKTTGSRIALAIFLSYDASKTPADLIKSLWWLPLEIGLYGIILDFWYYWYHRCMHDFGGLWKYHRTHHLTKHPNPLLAAFADHEQEFGDMVGVPFMAYLCLKTIGFPMGFYDWWICHQYVAFAEVFGHSGLRIHVTVPSTLSWLLQIFDCELVIEDHDLHHRKGWRKSHNYGKQTRLWDRVFGTCHPRIESVEGNVDYVNTVHLPVV